MSIGPDSDARADIASALDLNLFVEAGAGTGKTHELVGRVVALIAAGADVRELAVITFTEAAAAELRERVRERLAQAARARSGDEAVRYTDALASLDDAAIGTLHSFAQRVLAEFPVEAGLPPGFDVLDEIEADVEHRERWARRLDRLYEDAALERALTTAMVLGIGTRQLERVARELGSSWDLAREWAPPAEQVPVFDPTPVLEHIAQATALAPKCISDADTLFLHLQMVSEVATQVAAALDPFEALEIAAANPLRGGNKGRKDSWRGAKDEVLAALTAAEVARLAAVDRVRVPAIRTLLGEVAQFVRDSVAERQRDGRVEFHDLLVLAVDLLRSQPDARARLHQRYQRLLLDEFQDTDPLQIELAVLIATDSEAAGSTPWWECHVPPGRLFVVGDPKQSIYRFRRADIELYRRVYEVLGTREGEGRWLTSSFRSRPGILELVNEVFTPLMPDDEPLQAPYAELHPTRDPCDTAPDPVRTFGTMAPKGTDLDQLRRAEARELAAIVRRVRDEGWQVRDRSDSAAETRDARYADIAILLPTRATLPYLEEALDGADVPVRIESQSLVFATTEVQELLQVLRAVDDPVDDVAIVAALRSPGFACTDDQLVEFAQAARSWDYRRDPSVSLPADHPVVAGLQALRELHDGRWWSGPSELVERIIRDRRLLELAVERRRPRDHWRRLRFVADAARSYADRGGTSLRGFVSWAEQQADEEARVVEVIVPEPDDDAVRILTVHGSKGLEFPVVILSGLGLREQPRTGSVLFGPDGPEVRIGYDGAYYLTEGFEDLKTHEHEAWRAEQVRLLYVALTRAEDHLVVSMHRREGDKCLAALLADAASSRPELTGSAAGAPVREPAGPDSDATVVDRAAWIAERQARITAQRRAPVAAATALARGMAADADSVADKDGTDASEVPPWQRGRAGTAIGRAVHAVLQTVDLATGEGVAATARAQALAEAVPSREDEIRVLAESVLASPTIRSATAGGARCWREVPVAATVDGSLVEGFIDLLIEDGGGFTVVDYKTDQVPSDEDLDRALARYAPQGAAYALVLEEVLGRPVSRCVFVFARAGGAVEREIPDVAGAVAAVRTGLAGPQPGTAA